MAHPHNGVTCTYEKNEEYLYELAWNISRINMISYLKVKKSKGQAFPPQKWAKAANQSFIYWRNNC